MKKKMFYLKNFKIYIKKNRSNTNSVSENGKARTRRARVPTNKCPHSTYHQILTLYSYTNKKYIYCKKKLSFSYFPYIYLIILKIKLI